MSKYQLILNTEALDRAMITEGIDSNSELARLSGIDRAHLGRIRTGKRPVQPSQVIALARALRITPGSLLKPDDATIEAIIEAAS